MTGVTVDQKNSHEVDYEDRRLWRQKTMKTKNCEDSADCKKRENCE